MTESPASVQEARPQASLPRVSVCLLTYNCATLLARSIDSLLAQSHGDFEFVINDDCSTDGTEDLCRSYADRDKRIRYYKNRINLRFSGNQSAAILRAGTDFVALVHQGDVYRSDMLDRWTRALVEYPSAAIVFNTLEQMDRQGRTIGFHRHPYGPLTGGLQMFDEMIRHPFSPIFGITMVRRQHVWDAGPFDPRLPVLADVDMWFRLLLRHDVAYVPEPLVKIAPREPGHPTDSSNWAVRREHELIHVLNSARRCRGDRRALTRLRRQIAPMFWKLRLEALAHCAWHRRWRASWRGLSYMVRFANFAAGDPPDSVLDWDGARQMVDGAPTVSPART